MTTQKAPSPRILATLEPCEQYRYRVEFPDLAGDRTRDEMFRRALLEVTGIFLECMGNFQSVAWIGPANLSFADWKCSPSDRKSKFLHMLVCLRVIENRIADHGAGESADSEIQIRTDLPREFRVKLKKLCLRHGIRIAISDKEEEEGEDEEEDSPAGGYSGSTRQEVFVVQPLHAIGTFYAGAKRKLSGRPRWIPALRQASAFLTSLAWIYQYVLRGAFSIYYHASARRVLKRMDGDSNVFLYFEVRSGTNREVEPYLRWKYGSDFISGHVGQSSVIPFTHLSGTNAAFSLQAMLWARRALLRMEQQPADGCVVVNFLLTPATMWKLRSRRSEKRDKVYRRLGKFLPRGGEFLPGVIYREFREMLGETNAFAMEMAKCYQQFFASLAPGVVIQADALSKGARQLTTCARKQGGRVIYLADRVCTRLRTSNQLIRETGEDTHIPDRCVVFDSISREELLRQDFPGTHLHHYQRDFGTQADEPAAAGEPGEIRVLLQDYMDNLSALIATGVELARAFDDLKVVFQEHPDFPVDDAVKERLLELFPGRILFPKRGEITGYGGVLAILTGYSTAAVPGVLRGLPLIWLRRQVDNSIYGEAYLDRIGFSADSTPEVISLVRKIRGNDPETRAGCADRAGAAREIFLLPSGGKDLTLAAVLDRAVAESFAEISR